MNKKNIPEDVINKILKMIDEMGDGFFHIKGDASEAKIKASIKKQKIDGLNPLVVAYYTGLFDGRVSLAGQFKQMINFQSNKKTTPKQATYTELMEFSVKLLESMGYKIEEASSVDSSYVELVKARKT